ncbi:cas/CSE/importin domain protein, putative [Leishmania tarentolae]|uniref:Cas/CSE/importin domain protein, putative n=1 Tax=Leishmania tarentolae TaxID=5689 RepID=A0A640KN95_LEITA|nr:cas/CSE/importin domain protein, putative [Leishmania tarentolae]
MQPINPNDRNARAQFVDIASRVASPDPTVRTPAERELLAYVDSVDQQSGLPQLLLELIQGETPHGTFFAINFKNIVKKCWDPSTSEHCIQECDKVSVRATIIENMLRSSGAVQRNLAEAIALIAQVDFPTAWPDALTLIVKVLTSSNDVAQLRAALSTSHSVLRKYRHQGELTEVLVHELRTIYSMLCPALVRSMESLLLMTETQGVNVTDVYRSITDAVECLRDMTSLDLGDEFIERISSIVSMYNRCLSTLSAPSALYGAQASAMIDMSSAVIACMTHWLNSFDEDFENFAPQFIEVVIGMLANPMSSDSSMDDLVVCCLELVSSACRGTTRSYLNTREKLQFILQFIILPNLSLREDDLETYTSDPDEYIKKNIEGSNFHTRRRAAVELVRSLLLYLPEIARPLLAEVTTALLQTAHGDWRAKDTAIYLAFVLVVDGQLVNTQRGVTAQQLSEIIPVAQILESHVFPEIRCDLSAQSPGIVKADCMLVVAAFRHLIAPTAYEFLVPALTRHIAVGDAVVMTYAAHTLKCFLSITEASAAASIEAVFAENILNILEGLCVQIQATEAPNPYLMQYLMSVCFRFPKLVAPFATQVMASLHTPLYRAVRNPSNALYSQCMFEVISKCVALHPGARGEFEGMLWPNFAHVLRENVVEYIPYVLQVFAQLVRTYQSSDAAQRWADNPPENYQALVCPLTQAQMYEMRTQIPAPVCLLCAFAEVYPGYMHRTGMTNPALNVFNMLVRLKNYDHEGLNVLTSMLLAYPADVMDVYMDTVFKVLMDRLQNSSTPKYVRILILFLSVVVVQRQDADYLVNRLNNIESGLFMKVLGNVWLPRMQKITGDVERKTCVVALARLLCESTTLQSDTAAWLTSTSSCLRMLHDGVEPDDHVSFTPAAGAAQNPESLLSTAFGSEELTGSFHPLREAMQKPRDVCSNVPDAELFFQTELSSFLKGRGVHLSASLKQWLGPHSPAWLP